MSARVAAIGVDTHCLYPSNSPDFAVLKSWLPSGRYGLENLAGLEGRFAAGTIMFVGAPKHKGGTGGITPAQKLKMAA